MKPDINIMAPDQHRICAFCKPEREMGENYNTYSYPLISKQAGRTHLNDTIVSRMSKECVLRK
jgi:hypothetical protein